MAKILQQVFAHDYFDICAECREIDTCFRSPLVQKITHLFWFFSFFFVFVFVSLNFFFVFVLLSSVYVCNFPFISKTYKTYTYTDNNKYDWNLVLCKIAYLFVDRNDLKSNQNNGNSLWSTGKSFVCNVHSYPFQLLLFWPFVFSFFPSIFNFQTLECSMGHFYIVSNRLFNVKISFFLNN